MSAFLLEPGEQVVHQMRKHWFLFLAGFIPYVVLAIVPILIPPLLSLAPVLAPWAAGFAGSTYHTFLGLWWLLVWTAAWGYFTRYFLNTWILTNERIVEIKQRRFFHREVSSVLLNRVQDVTSEVNGIISSLLHIGRIKVQSAGATNEFYMTGIPHPEHVRDLILKYVPEEDLPPSGV